MYPSPNIKFASIVGFTVLACLSVIVGGILYGVKLSADTERACIQADRVWIRSMCLDQADDTRCIDD
jgi:hypothetical protein